MKARPGEYNPDLLDLLGRVPLPRVDDALEGMVKELTIGNLTPGMYAHEEILSTNGTLLVPKGGEITHPLIQRLKNFANGVGVREPVRVLVPSSRARAA